MLAYLTHYSLTFIASSKLVLKILMYLYLKANMRFDDRSFILWMIWKNLKKFHKQSDK